MSKLKKVLCVWLDETTDVDNPKWIVSKDELDFKGKTETTQTLKFFDDYDNAVNFAKIKAHDLELSVYETENTPSAKNELILGVYHAEIERGDFGLTTFFADNFNDAKKLTIEWAEVGEWKEDDELMVELKGPDGEDSFVVAVKASTNLE